MLIFSLKKSWYEKIKSGEKTIEYREVKPYWTKRFYNETIEHLKENRERFLLPSFTEFVKMFNYGQVLMAIFLQMNIQGLKPWNDRNEDEIRGGA